MSMTDPIADMLTRIRNGQQARLPYVHSPASSLRDNILSVLQEEGFISDFERYESDRGHPMLKIKLRYLEGRPVIKELKKISKPGRRVYSKINDLKRFYNGLGVAILSTPKGVISDFKARQLGVGGEVICSVF